MHVPMGPGPDDVDHVYADLPTLCSNIHQYVAVEYRLVLTAYDSGHG